jgi:hypothetical protein
MGGYRSEGEMMDIEKIINIQKELAHIYYDVYAEHHRSRKSESRRTDWEHKYWQGKKDGLRIALAALNELVPDGHDWEGLNESSNKGLGTARQVLTAQVNEAVMIFEAIREDGLDIHQEGYIIKFLNWVKYAKEQMGISYKEAR